MSICKVITKHPVPARLWKLRLKPWRFAVLAEGAPAFATFRKALAVEVALEQLRVKGLLRHVCFPVSRCTKSSITKPQDNRVCGISLCAENPVLGLGAFPVRGQVSISLHLSQSIKTNIKTFTAMEVPPCKEHRSVCRGCTSSSFKRRFYYTGRIAFKTQGVSVMLLFVPVLPGVITRSVCVAFK